VQVLELKVLAIDPPVLRCELFVSKGYYVRSLARDLGERLGAPAHLVALRRLASGPFTLAQATPWPAVTPPPLLGLAEAAASVLPPSRLRPEAVERARQGKRLCVADFSELATGPGPSAWLGPEGELVALGTAGGPELSVVRGFNPEP
jgi:tRNA pseudouridine55 synthase